MGVGVTDRRRLEGMLGGAGTTGVHGCSRDLLEHCLAHEHRGSAESGREGVRARARRRGLWRLRQGGGGHGVEKSKGRWPEAGGGGHLCPGGS